MCCGQARVLFKRISSISHSARAGAPSQSNACTKWICLRWKKPLTLVFEIWFWKLLRACMIYTRGKKIFRGPFPCGAVKSSSPGRDDLKGWDAEVGAGGGREPWRTWAEAPGNGPRRPSGPRGGTSGNPTGETHLWRRDAACKQSKLSCLIRTALKWTLPGQCHCWDNWTHVSGAISPQKAPGPRVPSLRGDFPACPAPSRRAPPHPGVLGCHAHSGLSQRSVRLTIPRHLRRRLASSTPS